MYSLVTTENAIHDALRRRKTVEMLAIIVSVYMLLGEKRHDGYLVRLALCWKRTDRLENSHGELLKKRWFAMGGTILVVEDDQKTAALVVLYLEREGFQTIVAHDGRQALELARRRQAEFRDSGPHAPRARWLGSVQATQTIIRCAHPDTQRPGGRNRPSVGLDAGSG